LEQWHLDSVIRDAELLTSELVTNAVRYGHCERTDIVAVADVGLTVAVSDAVPTPELTPGEPSAADVGGWGLYLVEELAQAWGVQPTDSGKVVWFHIRADDPATTPT
jgi:anti-sigma regulatory factor (Ser/Thr protein kinase)